jgi:hypothetical protein
VSTAFFLRSSESGTVAAFYPSPAGATECLLDLEAWDALTHDAPLLAAAEADVEAVIVRRALRVAGSADDGPAIECYVVPIDICYELVGRVRTLWKGFDGGAEARADIDAFFDRLRDRAVAYSGMR